MSKSQFVQSTCGSLVNVGGSIEAAMNIIEFQIYSCGATSGHNLVPPLVVSRLARGGTSTFLRVLFDRLKGQGYVPIVINFNGPFARRPGESNLEAVLRLICIQLLPIGSWDPSTVVCNQQYLLKYIADNCNNRKIVLLIDELNVLGVPLDNATSVMLKEHFLDKTGYFLVFSTHVALDLEMNFMSNENVPASSRGTVTVHMPMTTNLQELRAMSQECGSLTSVEAAFYGGIPSLMFSVKSLREMTPSVDSMNKKIEIPEDDSA